LKALQNWNDRVLHNKPQNIKNPIFKPPPLMTFPPSSEPPSIDLQIATRNSTKTIVKAPPKILPYPDSSSFIESSPKTPKKSKKIKKSKKPKKPKKYQKIPKKITFLFSLFKIIPSFGLAYKHTKFKTFPYP
jgi:hypothetical protein